MELADRIVVLNDGRIQQVGAPREVYDAPANEFVMGFLGPVARLGGGLVRPHDLVLRPDPESGAVEAQVTRVVHLGFEVRVELELAGDGAVAAQLTRHEAEQLEITEGDIVFVRPGGVPAPAPASPEPPRFTAGTPA